MTIKNHADRFCGLIISLGLWFIFIADCAGAASTRIESTGTYGIDNFVLENEFIQAIVAPYEGGEIKSLIWKPTGAQLAAQMPQGGLFRDMIQGQNFPGELVVAAYRCEVVAPGSAGAAVRVWTDGQSRLTGGIRFQRTYILHENAPYLDVNYDISSHGWTKKTLDFRVHNYLMLPDETVFKPCMPVVAGANSAKFNEIRNDMVDGWMATVGFKTSSALAMIFDYNAVDRALEWEGFTQELFYRTLILQPGQTFQTTIRLTYLADVEDVVGANKSIVITAKRAEKKVTVVIHALESLAGTLALDLLDIDTHAVISRIGEHPLSAKVGQNISDDFVLPDNNTNACYLRLRVKTPKMTYDAAVNHWNLPAFKLPVPDKKPVQMVQGNAVVPQLALQPYDEPMQNEIRGEGVVQVGAVQETFKTDKDGQRLSCKQVTVGNDKTDFSVYYKFYEGASKGGVAGEWSGLGLGGKGVLPFYAGGFIDVGFDGKYPMRQHRARIVPRQGIGKGGVDCIWNLPQANVILRLWLLAGDARVYGRIKLEKKTDYKTASVRMQVFPGWFHNEHDRWVMTPKRDWRHDDQGITITDDGGWMLLYDQLDDPATAKNSRGPAAVLWNPEDVLQVQVQCIRNYLLKPEFILEKDGRDFYFALWGFPYQTWTVARSCLMDESAQINNLLSQGPALANISRHFAKEKTDKHNEKIRVLQLATWRNPDGLWAEYHFPELEAYAKPAKTTYQALMGRHTFAQRYWFQGIKNFQYFLKDDPQFEVDIAYEDDMLSHISCLYDYDVLVINDIDLFVLDAFAKEIVSWVENGGGIVFLGGFGGFGGAGPDYGAYRDSAMEKLIPVLIEKVPDWDQNIAYQEGKADRGKEYFRYWEPDLDDEDRHTWKRRGPVLAIEEGWGWLESNKKVQVADPLHPITAGIPLNNFSPGYHRVMPRPGATNIAFIGEHPVIASASAGKGRTLALAFNDYRRFFFWPHTKQLYRQVVQYAARKESGLIIGSPAWNVSSGALAVDIKNDTAFSTNISLTFDIIGPDFRKILHITTNLVVPPNFVRQWEHGTSDLVVNDSWLPGRYRLEVYSEDVGSSLEYHDVHCPVDAPLIHIATDHKRHFTRDEIIQPKLSCPNFPDASVLKWNVELRDASGMVLRTANAVATTNLITIPLTIGALAYGEYRYIVSLVLSDEHTVAQRAIPVFICPNVSIPEYPVAWWGNGIGVKWFLVTDLYQTLAAIAGLKEHANHYVFLGRASCRIHEVCDRALGMGMPLGSHPVGCHYQGPVGSKRSKASLDFFYQAGVNFAPYAKHPALWFIYTDDEGDGARKGIQESDLPEFREKYNSDPPANPWEAPIEEQLKLADFNMETGCLMWGAAYDGFKKSNPNWLVGMVQCEGNRPFRGGGWYWECFNNQDLNYIDVYPGSVSQIDMDFFWFNQIRCVAARNGKPAWMILGMWRNDWDSIKMQWWLMMGSGLDGYQWYATSEGMESGNIDRLKPYNQWAMKYAPLLAQARKPRSQIAILQSKAVWSRFVENPEKNDKKRLREQCIEPALRVSEALYRHDLYPDVITEDHLRAGTAGCYEYIILPAVDVLEKDAKALLVETAKTKTVMADKDTTVLIPGAVPFNVEVIRDRVAPGVETPDPLVFAEPLKSGDLNCLVVYNHQHRKSEKTEVKAKIKGVKLVRDIFRQRDIPFIYEDGGMAMRMDLDAYDGAFLALLKEIPESITIQSPDTIKAGETLSLKVSLHGVSSGVIPIEITVIAPDGTPSPYGRTIAVAEDATVLFEVPFAGNDQSGKWVVHCRELLTDKKSEKTVLVNLPD